jgi:hypothetical protein
VTLGRRPYPDAQQAQVPASGHAQTPSGDKMEDDKTDKMDKMEKK